MNVENRKLNEDEFFDIREKVLATWPTGADIDLKEAVEYQRRLPDTKRMSKKVELAASEGRTLALPVAGICLIDENIELLRSLQDDGGADLLPTSTDAQTRNNNYVEAERLLEESMATGRSLMSGFPIVNHGLAKTRKTTEALSVPMITRLQAVDCRLVAELTFAGGYTGLTGGPMTSYTCYSKHISLAETIKYFQYTDRLVGHYTEQGCPLVREMQGYNIGLAYPHCLGIAYDLIDCLLAAEQGAKYFLLSRHQQGSFLQDVAASRVQTELAYEYLGKRGLTDVKVFPELRHWLGTFPIDPAEGYAVISLGTAIGVLAGANVIVLKTVDEGVGLPRKEVNAACTRATKAVINMLAGQRFPDSPELLQEMDFLRRETRAILDKLLDVGNGDLAKGVVEGMKWGFIDAPFAPNISVSDRVRPVRDSSGAIRILEFGNLPIPDDIKKYHRAMIDERFPNADPMEAVVSDIMEGMLRVAV